MNLETDTDYLKLLDLDQLEELREMMENKKLTKTDEYEAVLKEIKDR